MEKVIESHGIWRGLKSTNPEYCLWTYNIYFMYKACLVLTAEYWSLFLNIWKVDISFLRSLFLYSVEISSKFSKLMSGFTTKILSISMVYKSVYDVYSDCYSLSDLSLPMIYSTNWFHVDMRLFRNRWWASVSLNFLPRYEVFWDLIPNRRTTTWNLFVLYNDQKGKKKTTNLPCTAWLFEDLCLLRYFPS